MKREPTLADRMLAIEPRKHREAAWIDSRNATLAIAKRFVLDESAARYCARMLREHPRIVSDAADFAQRPFERMWIELPFVTFWQEMTGRVAKADADTRVGYLFDGPRVFVAAQQGVGRLSPHDVGYLPIEYILNRPMSAEDERAFCEAGQCSRLQIDFHLWGESATAFAGRAVSVVSGEPVEAEEVEREWNREGLRALRASHTVRIPRVEGRAPQEVGAVVLDGSGGDLRNIIGLLLFLNRTADIQTVREEGMAHAMLNRKPRPLLPHRVISLNLDPMPRLRKLVARHEQIARRLHDVRGHYCHDRRARESGCAHGRELAGDFGEWWREYEVLRWRCEGCNGKRWWRHEHTRGTLEAGAVAQSYAVTR